VAAEKREKQIKGLGFLFGGHSEEWLTTGREKKERQSVLSLFFRQKMNSILGLLYLLFFGFSLSRNFLVYTFFYIIFLYTPSLFLSYKLCIYI
jgi:hypothetical protein